MPRDAIEATNGFDLYERLNAIEERLAYLEGLLSRDPQKRLAALKAKEPDDAKATE